MHKKFNCFASICNFRFLHHFYKEFNETTTSRIHFHIVQEVGKIYLSEVPKGLMIVSYVKLTQKSEILFLMII